MARTGSLALLLLIAGCATPPPAEPTVILGPTADTPPGRYFAKRRPPIPPEKPIPPEVHDRLNDIEGQIDALRRKLP